VFIPSIFGYKTASRPFFSQIDPFGSSYSREKKTIEVLIACEVCRKEEIKVNKALGHCRLKKDGGAHNQPKNNGEFELRKKKKKKKGKGMLIAKSMQAMMEQAEKTCRLFGCIRSSTPQPPL
jgi:hypothetical protein